VSEFRAYNSKREIIQMGLVEPEDYTDNVILCVPKFAYDVARSLIGHYGKWRTSYAMEYMDQYYRIPNDAEFDQIEAAIDLFLGSRDMSCDITEGLECICGQLAELTAATYTSALTAGGSSLPAQESGEEGGDPPEGAGDPDATILTRKCKAAHWIVDNLQQIALSAADNNPPSFYSIGELTVYFQSLGFKTGFANMLGDIYNFYASIGSLVFGETIDYTGIYDDLVDNYEDLICALYSADSATDAKAAFLDELTVTGSDYDFVSEFLPYNIVNVLFFSVSDSEEQIRDYTTSVDCSACPEDCLEYVVTIGIENDPFDVTAVIYPTDNRYWVTMVHNCDIKITALTPSITLATLNNSAYRLYEEAGNTLVYSSDTPPPLPLSGINRMIIMDRGGSGGSGRPFDITWSVENE